MNYSLNLLEILGINISRELTREQRLPEERLFQAIILQAFEDALSIGELKQDAYAKQDSFNWFSTLSDDFVTNYFGIKITEPTDSIKIITDS